MPKAVAKRNRSWASKPQSEIPPRMSSLHPVAVLEEAPPRIPLSQMSFDQLMEILPTLDAAIIANDWLPCMQKCQQEVKKTMQIQADSLNDVQWSSQELNQVSRSLKRSLMTDYLQDLLKTIDEVGSVATSFHALFKVAKDLQKRDTQNQTEALEEANNKRSEAINALARHMNVHADKCAAYERQIADLQNDAQQAIRVLGSFIHENLADALDNSPKEQIEEVLRNFTKLDTSAEEMSNLVSRDLYNEIQHALGKAQSERDGLRNICAQQMTTIHQQSREMDQYLTRMARVISLVQEKEEANHKLRLEVEMLRSKVISPPSEARKRQTRHELANHAPRGEYFEQKHTNHGAWSQDAEIANLRTKLAQALDRERNLNQQLKQLLQISHGQNLDKRPNRLKRLLTGGTFTHDQSLLFPRGSSMLDLSSTSFSADRDKSDDERPTSASKSDTFSPEITTNFGGSAFEPIDMPPLFDSHAVLSPDKLPPRLRSTVLTSQHTQDKEIQSAVSSRFCSTPNRRGETSTPIPANVRIGDRSSLTSANEPWKSTSTSAPIGEEWTSVVPQGEGPPHPTKTGLPRSPSMLLFEPKEEHYYTQNYHRVLSGITELSETDTADYRRKSGQH